MAKNDFYRDTAGKISATRISPYGQQQLSMLQGTKLFFTDAILTVKGKTLIDEAGKIVQKISGDRDINKIIYRII